MGPRALDRRLRADWRELAALVAIDAVLRLLPGHRRRVHDRGVVRRGAARLPQYTRPATFEGRTVPPILVSGHHERVRQWRLRESLRRTLERRPDMLEGRDATPVEQRQLAEQAPPARRAHLRGRLSRRPHG